VFANAQIYFDTVAKPQYDAFLQNPSPSTCWGAVVSMHHITDYHVRDHRGSNVGAFRRANGLETLARLADCLKHAEKNEAGS
jgi:hypothetical protein